MKYENDKITLTNEEIQELIEDLRGTTQTISGAISKLFDRFDVEYTICNIDDKTLQAIEDEVFQCDGCGWWYEQPHNDENGDILCDDCLNEREEERDDDDE